MPNPSTADISFLILEVGCALLVLLIAFALPRCAEPFSGLVQRWAGPLARRQTAAIVLIGISAPLIRLLLLPVAPVPEPERHDEFSHLLAADTFASGRLTESDPPDVDPSRDLSRESTAHLHVDVSARPGTSAGVGQSRVWVPLVWSLDQRGAHVRRHLLDAPGLAAAGLGSAGSGPGSLAARIFGYWMNSYWGGALPAIGGALVLGALPRLLRRAEAATAVALALGLAILANSRPFEGMLLGIPVAGALLVSTLRGKLALGLLLGRIVAPAAALLALTAGLMGYYDWRVYGNPLTLPYQVNRATYAVSPYFVWETPRPEPLYRHKVMRDFYTACELPIFEKAKTPAGFLAGVATKIGMMVSFYWGAILVIPVLIMFRRLLLDRRVRWLLVAALLFLLGECANAFSLPHYLAPLTGLLFAAVIQAMRHLRFWRPGGQPVGRCLVSLIPALSVVLCLIHVAAAPLDSTAALERARVQQQLNRLPGRQLAIVRYTPQHHPLSVVWVYNPADIDSAPVVWAREMGPAEDRALIDYFKNRNVWLVEPDSVPPRVSPYVR